MINARVFLSHSSKQKGYVEIVANKLGKHNISYDAWTFEAGNKTLDEIYNGIDESGIFVYFISNESLNSDWVQKEINKAEEYVSAGKIKKFLPILIDNSIKHTDDRIPVWIKDQYNIRYISKPTKSYDLIRQALRLVSWELFPQKKQSDQLFIGRTAQIKLYEERIYDFEKPSPISIIVSGLPSIGRRKFIKHALVNSTKVRVQYQPPSIILDSRNSIEDLIVKLYGLGYSQLENDSILNLSAKPLNEKINLSGKLISEISENNDILFVIDNLAIVSKDGNLVDWFLPLNNIIKNLNTLALCIISQARVRAKLLFGIDTIFSINIPELEPYERKALFKSLLEINNIELDNEKFRIISDQFMGFPDQIIYTTSLLLQEGTKYVIDNPHEIIEFNTEKVAKLIRNFEQNQLALQLLKILSESEFLSFNILEDILKDDFEAAKKILTQFSNEFIIEYIGLSGEFLRLNDTVKDFVQRSGYKLIEKYSQNLQDHTKSVFKDYELIERDVSDYVLSVKEALKQGLDVPNELLIPSHYVNAMRELYIHDRRFKEVIVLADRILQNEKFLDRRIIKEIRYWLCHSLARRRDKRVLEEVQKIDGPDHNFILGFYYRLVGRNEDAIQKFLEVLKSAPGFYRAKRELVQVYLNTEQYDEAFELSRENYYSDRNNPYNLQSYFRCLIKVEGPKQREELYSLLTDLKNNPHEKAKEMYSTSLSQFYAFVENNDYKAIKTADDAIASFPKNIYPFLTKLEILRKTRDVNEIQTTIHEIKQKFDDDSDILIKLPYLACNCIVLAKTGKKEQAMKIIETEIKQHFSNSIYNKLLSEIKDL